MWQLVGRDADARILNANDRLAVIALKTHLNLAAMWRELAGVVEQVAKNLRQTNRVTVHIDRVRGQHNAEPMPHFIAMRPGGLDGLLDYGRQIEPRTAQFHL